MPSTVDTEMIPLAPEMSEAEGYVTIREKDLLRLRALAAVAGADERDSGSVAELLSVTLHRGIAKSCKRVGLGLLGDPALVDAALATRADKPAASGSRHRMGTRTSRRLALLAAGAAMALIVVGSYIDRWSWTGLTSNGQVWDWLELLLLPVAIGTFPLWLRFSGVMSRPRRETLGAAVLAFTAFMLAGYLIPLSWTGFRGHTLWNWLNLIVLPITIGAAAVWPKTGRRFGRFDRAAAGALGVAWIVTVIGGYADNWAWTGYPGNTLWEWVKLFLAPIAVTTFFVPELISLVAGNVADTGQAEEGARDEP